jgi:hypothetical protein
MRAGCGIPWLTWQGSACEVGANGSLSAVSAWYTRRQAVSAEGVRSIEVARTHDELRPAIVGEYVQASDTRSGRRPGVKVTNHGPLDLDRVDVRIIPAHRAQAVVSIQLPLTPKSRKRPSSTRPAPTRLLTVLTVGCRINAHKTVEPRQLDRSHITCVLKGGKRKALS